MDNEFILLFFAYLFIILILVLTELYVLSNNKVPYLNTSYIALREICRDCVEKNLIDVNTILSVSRFYEEYVQEEPKIKKYFPNVVVWLNAIIFRIDCGNKKAFILKEYKNMLEMVRNGLEMLNPYNKCEKYQQDILHDISKLETDDNKIIISNIIKRTEDEFIRLSNDIKKNDRSNKLSIMVGVVGIIISIFMALINF